MSRFPDLLPAQRRALFDIVEAFRQHEMEGRAVGIAGPFIGDGRLLLSMGGAKESPRIDTDLDTLRVLDEAGYVALTETYGEWQDGRKFDIRSLTLKRLGSDYYDWCHNPPWYKPIAEIWFSLAPDTRSAIVGGLLGAVLAWVLTSLPALIRGCLSR